MSSKILCNLRSLLRQPVCTRFLSSASEVTTEDVSAQEKVIPVPSHPLSEPILKRELQYPAKYVKPREAWVENLDTIEEFKLGLVHLHPDIFSENPRIDVIHHNVKWQTLYRFVSYANTKNRAEVRGGGRKPWQQKGLGRARHGSIRSPLFRGGGVVHGPRSPTTHFYMLPFAFRILGLTSTLSIKLAQDDLHIVNNLDLPTADPKFIEDLIEERNWGPSVLIVDTEDIMPENITLATDKIKHVNLMPVYGLNVYSMIKHSTLVLTLRAVERIEERILYNMHRADAIDKEKKYVIGS